MSSSPPPSEPATERYICTNCGYVYDPAQGDLMGDIPAGTSFDDLPEQWCCPLCYVGKDEFDPLD